jgi:hypothetical protein
MSNTNFIDDDDLGFQFFDDPESHFQTTQPAKIDTGFSTINHAMGSVGSL